MKGKIINKNRIKETFYKTNPSGGISLIVLVITIIVVIILAAAVIISLQNNNPMVEANKARINSDVANMQAIFTNTVGKIMAENQDVVQVVGGPLYTIPTGQKKTVGEATYKILGTDGTPVVEGKIIFGVGEKLGTTYYTGKELPLYGSDTKWSVDNQGLLSVVVAGLTYGEGEKITDGDDKPVTPPENLYDEIEIVESENPIIKSYTWSDTSDFHAPSYCDKITKIKFEKIEKVPGNRITEWDISKSRNKSVMAWLENDGDSGYILKIGTKSKVVANQNSSYLFRDLSKVKEIENIQLLDTSVVTDISYMFSGCKSLIRIDLSSFNTSNVTSMSNLFNSCISLTSINFGENFSTSNVTSMSMMFYTCSSLTNIDLSKFDTSSVTSMGAMFSNCASLESLDVSNFNTTLVTSMNSMFNNCSGLTNIDVSNFDTSKVKYMGTMFASCTNLTSLNLSNFNTSQVIRMSSMFSACKNLTNLNLGDFDTSSVTDMSMMFFNCEKLTTTMTVKNTALSSYNRIFDGAATASTAKIIVNYTSQTFSLVDNMINTKSSKSNVVKGVQV